jgi:N-acetyl-gamma-glutamyl-phosphate reductase
MSLMRGMTLDEIRLRYRDFYAGEPLVAVQEEVPWVSRSAGKNAAVVGGFTLSEDGRRLVVVSVLDNLLKGAATQAVQNLNRAFGFPEMLGVAP